MTAQREALDLAEISGAGRRDVVAGESTTPSTAARATARRLYAAGGERTVILGPGLFCDPAWDMLLDLVVWQGVRRLSVSAVCLGARVPHATAIRYVGLLLERGLIERVPDARDRRRTHLRLSVRGVAAMEAALRGFG